MKIIPNWFRDKKGIWHNVHIINGIVYLDGNKYIKK